MQYLSPETQLRQRRWSGDIRHLISVLRKEFIRTGETRWSVEYASELSGLDAGEIRHINTVPLIAATKKVGSVLYHKDMDVVFYEEG